MSLCFLCDQLPFNVISQLELKRDDSFKPATDTREETQQNEHEFFATSGRWLPTYEKSVCKFVKVNDKWSQDKVATVTNRFKKCLVLPSD